MEVAMIENSPFQREVREWQRVDPTTGALLTGRLEADRWNNGSDNKYGKVIDSQKVSTPNGTQLSQRKELEVLQARTTSGSLQVVRSSTIHTSSSRRSIPSLINNDTNATVSNDNRSFSNISKLINDKNSSSSLFKTNWNGTRSPIGYERGRSASTEDVTLDQLRNVNSSDTDDDDEPMEWRRVSKIRRSLQYPKSTPKFNTRPTDLPENLVNVSKIKRDLENGFGSTFIRNTNLDLTIPTADNKYLNEHRSEVNNKNVKKATFITADSLRDIRGKLKRLSDESLYKDDILAWPVDSNNSNSSINDTSNTSSSNLQNNSAETIVKYRETSAPLSDWHLRRKSYGFENMPVQNNSEMSRMESSTDSGLGRSGDIWSSMESNKPRGTIITLGEGANESSSSVFLNRDTISNDQRLSPTEIGNEIKRHSIAVDETKYVKDSKTLINLNGLNSKEWNSSSSNLLDENGRRMKRVEFCKTEVHFAADSGRVNIVETDGKPPSTNNFRRRRRISAPSASIDVSSNGPLMHFGDEKLVERNAEKLIENEVRVLTMESRIEDVNATAMTNRDEDDDMDEISLRGILKNKPVKPKPYHLGENIDNTQNLWGVRLKPAGNEIIKTSNGICKVRDQISSNNNRSPSRDNLTQSIKSQLLSHSDANDLKSTSLIMKTIKSANQFDEAMKNLTVTERTSVTPEQQSIQTDQEFGIGLGSSFKLVSSLNSSKSSSSSSILFEDYSTAKEDVDNSNAMNFENNSSSAIVRKFDKPSDIRKPIAAPRIKKIGPSTGLSLQLSQLRRIYEAADQSIIDNDVPSKDSDNGYLINKDQPEEYTTELSSSWSRVKARRNMIKQQHRQFEHCDENDADDKPNMNMMSITLHSPTESTKMIDGPIAKPRTNTYIPDSGNIVDYDSEPLPFKREIHRKNISINFTDKQILSKSESFKPANGARKLKEHELSYFGLNVKSSNPPKILNENTTNTNLHNGKLNDGKLTSDKPDLLINHSPNVERSPKNATNKSEIIHNSNNPIYENLKSMKGYDRKLDLHRDEMILKELNEAADEVKDAILKRAEKEKSPKKHRQSKPFDTIVEEKEKLPQKQMQSKAVQVSRGFNEILTRIKPLTRASSASSSESISSTGRSRRLTHSKPLVKSSGDSIEPDSNKCSRQNGHSLREGHQRSSHGSGSSRKTNSTSHETSVEDVRPIVVAPRRSRRSNGADGSSVDRESKRKSERKHDHNRMSSSSRTSNDKINSSRKSSNGTDGSSLERESQRKSERKHDHNRMSSSSRTSNDKINSSRKSHRSKELSSKEKALSTKIESDKKPQKSSITTTTTTYVLQQSYMIPPPRKKRRLRNVSRGGTSTTFAKRNIKNRKRQKLLGTCICS